MSNDAFSSPEVAPLAAAVRAGDGAEVRRQAERVPVDTEGANGETLLFEAIRLRQRDSVEALLAAGADPGRANAAGDTPVHVAAFEGDPAVLQAVIAGGGDVDARNTQTGATPLVQALLSPNGGQYAVLLDAGADPNLPDRNGDLPLHVAARTNAGGAILALLDKGARPTATNSGGASFQAYYFSYRRQLLNDRAKQERHQVVAWLKAHGIPLEANVTADD